MRIAYRGRGSMGTGGIEHRRTRAAPEDSGEAHRDALTSGRIRFGIRIFKRESEAARFEDVLAQGYSSDTMEIFGFITWATLESIHLRKWQLPPGHSDFSLADLPSWFELGPNLPAHRGNHAERVGRICGLSAIGLLALAMVVGAPNWPSAIFAFFAVLFCVLAALTFERIK
jgi:hypothetical protein